MINGVAVSVERGAEQSEETLCCTYTSLLSKRVFLAVRRNYTEELQMTKQINNTLKSGHRARCGCSRNTGSTAPRERVNPRHNRGGILEKIEI